MLQGRDFLDTDTADSMPVAIVNAAMAKKYWPGQDAIGKQVGLPIRSFNMTVVGIVANVKHLSLREEPGPEIYVPFTQKPWPSMLTMHVAVRTQADPASMTGAIRAAIRAVDPDLPIAERRDARDHRRRRDGAAAILDAAGRRLRRAGAAARLRRPLRRRRVFGDEPRAGNRHPPRARRAAPPRVRAGAAASACGSPASASRSAWRSRCSLLKAIAGFLYGVEATDPATFARSRCCCSAVALLACYVPARRATRVDPLTAMRAE